VLYSVSVEEVVERVVELPTCEDKGIHFQQEKLKYSGTIEELGTVTPEPRNSRMYFIPMFKRVSPTAQATRSIWPKARKGDLTRFYA
jgi:hypothetical protein